ncbi:ABC transporter permease [Actinokineospora xionganensis]|uniref:ABC transporter permease n=2 Tax=Actinokineospora xionganensis TaxID=2684470 RepID=A0ABR7L0K1_9PSEU|nr:ABC transporter permease [Actinokineospora xionganensis]
MLLETPPSRGPVADAALQIGHMLDFAVLTLLAGLRSLRYRRFPWRECVHQMWFLATVTTLPAVLVTVPLGVMVAVNIGSLAGQLGAQGYGGAVVAFVIVGQAAPLICALMISGVGGSAICADLGSRKIREETDALEVMGVSTVERLAVPRVVAATVVTVLLNGVVMAVGIGVSFAFQVIALDNSPGSFLGALTEFSRLSDFMVAEIKAAAFAVCAAIVACYKGLTVKGGPSGVGDAVNEAVVLAFVLVFIVNVVVTELYTVIVPARGAY